MENKKETRVRPLYEKLGVLYESPGFRDPLCVVD